MKSEWWKEIFDERYLKTYIDMITPEATARQVKFVQQQLNLSEEDKVLDLACGYGRHSVMLAQHVRSVTGLDFSAKFVALARAEAKKRKIFNVNFIRGDMRKLGFEDEFDAVISMFTSFGYFSDEENFTVLRSVSRALKKRGRFLVDVNNPFFVAQTILENREPGMIDRLRSTRRQLLSNGIMVQLWSEFNPVSMRWRLKREWLERAQKKSYQSSIRLYAPAELVYLLGEVGLKLEKIWGGFTSEPFQIQSPRLIIFARKI